MPLGNQFNILNYSSLQAAFYKINSILPILPKGQIWLVDLLKRKINSTKADCKSFHAIAKVLVKSHSLVAFALTRMRNNRVHVIQVSEISADLGENEAQDHEETVQPTLWAKGSIHQSKMTYRETLHALLYPEIATITILTALDYWVSNFHFTKVKGFRL